MNIGAIGAACMNQCADIGVPIIGCKHQLLYSAAELLGASVLAAGQFPYRAIDIRLAPQKRSPVIEEIEVVRVIALLLNDLQLHVLVIQSFVIGG